MHTFFQGKRKLLKNPECKNYIQYSEIFQKNSVFRASASSSKIVISMQWKFSGQALFFRASASCSKFWMIWNIYIQYSEFRVHSVFQGNPQVAQKSWKIKNISSEWKVSGQLCFSVKESCSKTGAEPDIFIWGCHWRGQFCNKESCQWSVQDFQKETWKFWGGQAKLLGGSCPPPWHPLAPPLFKNLNDKKSVTGRQGRQGREFLP